MNRAENVFEFRRVNMHGTKTGPHADPDYTMRNIIRGKVVKPIGSVATTRSSYRIPVRKRSDSTMPAL
jgi:hypothetical protein